MAEEDGNTPDGATEEPTVDTTPTSEDLAAEVAKWKAMSRKHEADAKAGKAAAAKLKEIEDAGKSEIEKAQAKITESEQKAAAAEARALRLEIAAEKGLTPAQAKRLVGTTKEELEADADELLSTFKPADKAGESDTDGEPESTGKPREALRPGTSSVGEEKEQELDLSRISPIN